MNLILLFFFIFSLSGMYSIISSILHSKQAQIRLSTSILTFLFLLNLDKDAEVIPHISRNVVLFRPLSAVNFLNFSYVKGIDLARFLRWVCLIIYLNYFTQ